MQVNGLLLNRNTESVVDQVCGLLTKSNFDEMKEVSEDQRKFRGGWRGVLRDDDPCLGVEMV